MAPEEEDVRGFSCAIFDAGGELLAQAAHIPVHLGSMPASVAAVRAALPGLGEGDRRLSVRARGDREQANYPLALSATLSERLVLRAGFDTAPRPEARSMRWISAEPVEPSSASS